MKKRIIIGVVGEKNLAVGGAHPHARLSDEDVELIRAIYEEGFLGYAAIARGFGVSKSTVQHIVTYRKRSTAPDRYRTIEVEIENGELVGKRVYVDGEN